MAGAQGLQLPAAAGGVAQPPGDGVQQATPAGDVNHPHLPRCPATYLSGRGGVVSRCGGSKKLGAGTAGDYQHLQVCQYGHLRCPREARCRLSNNNPNAHKKTEDYNEKR